MHEEHNAESVSFRQDSYWWQGSVLGGQIGHRVADDESVPVAG